MTGIVANIAAPYFTDNAGAVSRALAGRGILLATGFLREDAPAVAAALGSHGLSVTDERSGGGWILLEARKESAGEGS
jgi:ribosomal protein L11 methylase PrmA